MTDESKYILTDFDWTDESIIDLTEEGNKLFGKLQMFPVRASLTRDSYFTLPGVFAGRFDEADDQGLRKFNGYKLGGHNPHMVYILVGTFLNQDGEEYQRHKIFPTKKGRGSNAALYWKDIVMPGLNKLLTKAQKKELVTKGLYMSWSEVVTEDDYTNDEGETFQIKTWGEFDQVFAGVEEMKAASDAFFSGDYADTADTVVPGAAYPAHWGNDITSMLDWIEEQLAAGNAVADIAKEAGLLGDQAVSSDGQPVDAEAILRPIAAKVQGVPEPMAKLELPEQAF